MMTVLVPLVVFSIFFVIHVIIHRLAGNVFPVQAVYAAVFLPGFFVLLFLTNPTAVVFYLLFVGAHFLFFFSFYYEGESPSVKILDVLKKESMYEEKLQKFFTEKEMFLPRLKMLEKRGFVVKNKDRFFATQKGKIIAGFFEHYRKILNWDKGGL